MLIALLLAVATAPPPSVEAAAARFGPALVTVRWAVDQSSTGFLVSSTGTLATTLPEGIEEVVVELAGGDRRPGRLLTRDAEGVALVSLTLGDAPTALPSTMLLPALAVASEDRVLAPQVWLLGVAVVEGRVEPSLGGLRRVDDRGRWRLDLPLDRGAPVLFEDRVVAIVLARDGRTASIAVPSSHLRALAARVARPPAPPR